MSAGKYDDIIHLPHHQSATRPHMSLYDRAAQFSPFAALSGYDDMVKETSRLTDRQIELSEEDRAVLDQKLFLVQEAAEAGQKPLVSLTFFIPDQFKEGGAYHTVTGKVRNIDPVTRSVIFYAENEQSAGQSVRIDVIRQISGDLVDSIDDWQA